MITVPLWLVLCVLIGAAGLAAFVWDANRPSGEFIPSPPWLGCLCAVAAVVGILVVLLVHAWGWL